MTSAVFKCQCLLLVGVGHRALFVKSVSSVPVSCGSSFLPFNFCWFASRVRTQVFSFLCVGRSFEPPSRRRALVASVASAHVARDNTSFATTRWHALLGSPRKNSANCCYQTGGPNALSTACPFCRGDSVAAGLSSHRRGALCLDQNGWGPWASF